MLNEFLQPKEEDGMEDEVELVKKMKEESEETELVLNGAQGEERYVF